MKKILKIFLIGDLVALNLGIGYFLYQYKIQKPSINNQIPNTTNLIQYIDRCGTECQKIIEAKISALPTIAPSPTTIANKQVKASKKTRREEVLTIPGSGSSVANEWEKLAGTSFYFDTRDYPGLVEVYFEANMKLRDGNGLASVRLYDQTNLIGVVGSENTTSNQADTWTKSQKVYFWAGRNYIMVQAKSLTADTVVYNQGRLRMVMEY